VVRREARCGEHDSAWTREGGWSQVSRKSTKKKTSTPIEAEDAVNDAGGSGMALSSGKKFTSRILHILAA
jgi:hypothetical protein